MMNKSVSPLFMLSGILLCVCLILSNLLATKAITIGGLSATAGLIIFPLSYIINDTVVEVWGFKKARMIIWLAFSIQLLAILFIQLSVFLPPAPYWTGQEAYSQTFSQAPRVAFAGLVAFFFGSFANAYVMSKMKVRSGGKRFGVRAVVSTLWGEMIDSILFFSIAFAGIFAWKEIVTMILLEATLKSAYEIIILPFTKRTVNYIKNKEQTDVYDTEISYHLLKVKEIS
jgi:conserved hypothetical integral membrane protein